MLKAGDRAPDFSLESDSGNKVSLGDHRGKTVVLYFYPRDNTPGCTREAQAFTAAIDAFTAAGAVVLGVSRDSVASHGRFRDKYGLRVRLLSDPDLAVHNAYGAYGQKMMYGKAVTGPIRSTFVIGPDGKLTHVFPSVKVDGHADAVLALLGSAGAPTAAKKAAPAAKSAAPAAKKAAAPAAKKTAAPAAKKTAAPAPTSAAPAAKKTAAPAPKKTAAAAPKKTAAPAAQGAAPASKKAAKK